MSIHKNSTAAYRKDFWWQKLENFEQQNKAVLDLYVWTVVLEKIPKSPLDSEKTKPVNPEGNQPWIFIGRTCAKTETPILWPADAESWLIWKDPDAGKDWGWEEKWVTEDEMVGWHHQLDGHEFEQAPWVGGVQGGLECCSPWGPKERHDWVTGLTYWQGITSLNLSWCSGCSCLWGSGGKSTSKFSHSRQKSVSCSCRTEVSNSLIALVWGLVLAVSSCLSPIQFKTGVSAFF